MSVQAQAWALKQRIAKSPTHRHVLLVLANYAGEDGRGAWPSVMTLCDETALSESTVRRSLSALENLGCIRRGNQAIAAAWIGRPDRLPVVWDYPALADLERGVAVTPRKKEAEKRAKNRGVSLTPRSSNGVSLRPERGVTVTPNTSVDPLSRTTTAIIPLNWDALPRLDAAQRVILADEIERLDSSQRQDVLDELAGALRAKVIKKAWRGWFRSVVLRASEGKFTPNHALSIQSERKKRKTVSVQERREHLGLPPVERIASREVAEAAMAEIRSGFTAGDST